MKTTKIFSILAVLAFVLTGCQDDDFGKKYGPAKVGDEIIFGGTAGYEPEGRTVYGDKVEGKNGYTEIKWYTGDKVRIYCEQAQSVTENKYADYNVVNGLSATESPYGNGNEPTHSSALSAMDETGLRWGSNTDIHKFYGVYPAPAQLEVSGADELSKEAAGKLELNGNTLKGYLPNRQTPISGKANYTYANGTYTIHPSMRYAYMTAYAEASASNDGYAQLTFKPIVTAVEITLKNVSVDVDDNGTENSFAIKNIEAFRVSSNEVICGEFTTNIDDKTNTVTSTGDAYKQIFIPTNIDSLAYGESVTFTAFLMLDESVGGLNELNVSIITASGQKSAKVNGKSNNNSGIIVQAKMKNFLANIPLNLGEVKEGLNGANWIAYIPDVLGGSSVLVKNLSIPGAGGAASSQLYENGHVTFAQQSLSIANQWKQGIRCFEFAVDLPGTTVNTNNIDDEIIICAGEKTGITLGTAVNEVKKCLLASPNEFAMVIITYENLGGWADVNNVSRNPSTFMSKLNDYWARLANSSWVPTGTKEHDNAMGLKLYSADLTLAQARGKLLCIARPTSTGQDDFIMTIEEKGIVNHKTVASVYYDETKLTVSSVNSNILVINGWGSLKDKWIARGYTSCVFDRGKKEYKGYGGDVVHAVGYDGTKDGRPFDVSSFTNNNGSSAIQSNYVANTKANDANFLYATQAGSDKTPGSAWVQEWARVSPEGGVFGKVYESNSTSSWKEFYWAPTVEEKKLRIKETLNYAINKTHGEIIYINSLCGYFIDANIAESYKPHTLTDYSGKWQKNVSVGFLQFKDFWCVQDLTLKSEYAGMQGNIDTYSKYINNYFYSLLSNEYSSALSSGLGIVLMDRVSNSAEKDPAGYYIPQIIWNSNTFVEKNGL